MWWIIPDSKISVAQSYLLSDTGKYYWTSNHRVKMTDKKITVQKWQKYTLTDIMWQITDWLKWKSACAILLSAETVDVLDGNKNTGLPAGRGTGITPHGGAAGQDALSGSAVIGVKGGGWGSRSLQFAEEVEPLVGFSFLGQCRGVNRPGEFLWDMHTQRSAAVAHLSPSPKLITRWLFLLLWAVSWL